MYANLKAFSVMGLSAEKEAHATKRDFFLVVQSKQEALSEAGVPAPELKMSEEVEEEGCTTPKAGGESEFPKCPPPPRKPKSLPSKKRKAAQRGLLLDLSSEIDSLFPSNIIRDFMCGKIKKVRTGCPPQIL